MGRTTFTAAAACFVALLGPSIAHSQVSFAQYLECDQTREARADTIATEILAPVLDRLVSEGKLQSFSWLAHGIGGKWKRLGVITGTDLNTVMSARAELFTELQEKHPGELQELASICPTHEDYVWNVIVARP
jgi:hypothetical protein